eukprot:scaffold109482_cov35-Tisochrysis_lutea.AAC.1
MPGLPQRAMDWDHGTYLLIGFTPTFGSLGQKTKIWSVGSSRFCTRIVSASRSPEKEVAKSSSLISMSAVSIMYPRSRSIWKIVFLTRKSLYSAPSVGIAHSTRARRRPSRLTGGKGPSTDGETGNDSRESSDVAPATRGGAHTDESSGERKQALQPKSKSKSLHRGQGTGVGGGTIIASAASSSSPSPTATATTAERCALSGPCACACVPVAIWRWRDGR